MYFVYKVMCLLIAGSVIDITIILQAHFLYKYLGNMAQFKYIFIFGVVLLALRKVSAVTEEERVAMRTAALPALIACGADHGVTKEQALAAKEAKNPDALNPCFYACFFKKAGIINENGIFDPETTLEKHKKYIHSEDDLKKITEIGKTCTSVNDQTVGDGAKGCERSKLLIHCLLEHKAEFTPFSS